MNKIDAINYLINWATDMDAKLRMFNINTDNTRIVDARKQLTALLDTIEEQEKRIEGLKCILIGQKAAQKPMDNPQ